MAVHDADDILGGLLMRGSLDHCVKCTICETYCPVSNVTAAVPGARSTRGRSPSASASTTSRRPTHSVNYCSGCGICTQVCPQGVHIAEINTQAKAKYVETNGAPLRDRILARPDARGPARHARRADRQLVAAQPPHPRRRSSA